ncbi:hypothetical protein JCM10908_003665 [Rhodotorula pacifica]|uniref:uncharacterized protein n=1 Tax=Rhodotorula pacifica TaxID=1495444 RepID=UPI00317E51C1
MDYSQEYIDNDRAHGPVQQAFNRVAGIVQTAVNEAAHRGQTDAAELLINAYRHWRSEAIRLLQYHRENSKKHHWSLLNSHSVQLDLVKFANKLEEPDTSLFAMADMLDTGWFFVPPEVHQPSARGSPVVKRESPALKREFSSPEIPEAPTAIKREEYEPPLSTIPPVPKRRRYNQFVHQFQSVGHPLLNNFSRRQRYRYNVS